MINAIYTFPEAGRISEIERERQLNYDKQTLGGQVLPMTSENGTSVQWDIRENVGGFMFSRQPNEPYPLMADVGGRRFGMDPGYFGGTLPITAEEINRRAKYGTFGEKIDIGPLIEEKMHVLAERAFNTVEFIRWTVLATGRVLLPKKDGSLIEVGNMTLNRTTVGTPWTNASASTPLADLTALRDSKVGLGFDFGAGILIMGTPDVDLLYRNRNTNDLGYHRVQYGNTIYGLEQLNRTVLTGLGLPNIMACDDTYIDANGVVQRFIPQGTGIWIGRHATRGTNCGEFVLTSNEALMGEPGVFANADREKDPPYLPRVSRGFNGGPRINYTNQVQIISFR